MGISIGTHYNLIVSRQEYDENKKIGKYLDFLAASKHFLYQKTEDYNWLLFGPTWK